MAVVTTRSQFQTLADARLREAKALLAASEWDGAYNLAGYAVEFALKAVVIARLAGRDDYPNRGDVDLFFRHDLDGLVRLAKLETELSAAPTVSGVWGRVKMWSEQSRYETGRSETDARALAQAIEVEVLPWIRARW